MKEPDITTINLIRNTLSLRSGVSGFFDWNTAAIRINCSKDEYSSRIKLADELGGVRDTYFHERFHLGQALICGYIYNHCAKFYSLVDSILYRSDFPYDNKDVILKQHKAYHLSLQSLTRENKGLNPISIIESLTHYNHIMTFSNLSSKQYLELIKRKKLPQEYKSSYLIFYDKMNIMENEKYHRFFPLISQFSLCFEFPERAFFDICDSFLKGEIDGDTLLLDIMSYGKNNFYGYIGWSWESNMIHPIYDNIIRDIAAEELDELITGSMMSPFNINHPKILKHMRCPIILNPSDSEQNPIFKDYPILNASVVGDLYDVQNLVYKMAIGRSISLYPEIIDKFF